MLIFLIITTTHQWVIFFPKTKHYLCCLIFQKIKKKTPSESYSGQSILVASPNGKKTNTIKSKLAKDKESLVLECYLLNKKL